MLSRRNFLKLATPALIFPQQTMAWGHGAACIAAPSFAAAAGYTQCKFFDDFLSAATIDLGYTRQPGFKWYLGTGAWQNSVSSWYNPGIHFDPANISVANSAVTLANGAWSNGTVWVNGIGMMSITPVNSGGYIGYTLPRTGYYWETSLKFDPTLIATGYTAWPALWSTDIKGLFIQGQTTMGVELDLMELQGNYWSEQVIPAYHDWSYNRQLTISPNSISFASQMSDGNYHKFGIMWTPMAAGGGTGTLALYFDRVNYNIQRDYTNMTYSATGGASPPAMPMNPNGDFSTLDTAEMPMFFGTGNGASFPNLPMSVDYVAVWGLP